MDFVSDVKEEPQVDADDDMLAINEWVSEKISDWKRAVFENN